jgi:hypothetical protein
VISNHLDGNDTCINANNASNITAWNARRLILAQQVAGVDQRAAAETVNLAMPYDADQIFQQRMLQPEC